jgi:hypothetical protein
MKITASKRLQAAKERDQKDADRYRAIRKRVLETGTLTLKSPGTPEAFDKAIDKVLL